MSASSTILIVEDDIVTRSLLSRTLRDLSGIVLLAVGTYTEALALLAETPPQVLIVDLELPDGNGQHLVSRLLNERSRTGVIVVSAHLDKWHEDLPTHRGVKYLAKPVDLHRLKRLVRAWTQTALPPPPFGVAEYLQLACLGRHSVAVNCDSETARGSITVYDGELWSAGVEDSQGKLICEGIDAFRHWVASVPTRVEVSKVTGDPPPRLVHGHWEHLLLDALKLMDEGVSLTQDSQLVTESPPPPAPARITSRKAKLAGVIPDVDNLVAEAVRAITEGRYAEAEAQLTSALALAPEDHLIAHRLHKLRGIRGS